MKKGKRLELEGYSRPSEVASDIAFKIPPILLNIRRLQKKVVEESFGIKVGDKVRPKKAYTQRHIDHSGVVVAIQGLSRDIKLNNGAVMKDIAVSYLEKYL